MNWMNLRTELIRSPEFANAKPGAIETWLRVMAYCCEQENGGSIDRGCEWTDRGWLTTCGVTSEEVRNAAPLLYDDGVAVFVTGYPEEKEAEVKAKRDAGKRGGLKSAASRASSRASRIPATEGEGEGEGERNRKEKEKGNGKEPPEDHPPRASASDVAFAEFWKAYPKRAGKGDAEKAWTKHKCSSMLPLILTKLRTLKISPDWTKDNGQFIPHPATWLNRHGWEDEVFTGNGTCIRENLKAPIISLDD